MKTSVRNRFLGTIRAVSHGPTNAEAVIDIGGGNEIAAMVSHESAEQLGLASGVEARAMFDASCVVIAVDDGAKTTVRNRLAGRVSRIHLGTICCEVVIDLLGGKSVAATVDRESISRLGLRIGATACTLVKASHVILDVAE